LENICLKCLERDPQLRYPSAQDLADELGRFLKGEPVRARPIGPAARLARWCRRNPALAFASALVATLLMVVAVGSPIALVRIQGERARSEDARQREAASRMRAETAEREARQQLYTALLQQAQASVRSGEIGQRLRALDSVRRAAAISNSVELRREALAALALPDLRFERELPTGSEFTLQWLDSTFERVALCRGRGPVEIRAVSDWRLKAVLPASTNLPAYGGLWNSDGRYFAVKRDHAPGGERADLEVWDVSSQHRLMVLNNMVNSAVSFHPLEHRLICAQSGEGITIWDLEKGNPSARFAVANNTVRIEFAPAGDRFAAVNESDDNSSVSVYDATTGLLHASHTFPDAVMALQWHPNGRWLAIADYGSMVHLMDSQSGQTRLLGSHKAQAVTLAFSPDGHYLFSGGWEREVICWDTRRMQRVFMIGQTWTAQVRSDGQKCAFFTPSGIQLHTFLRPLPREFSEDLGSRLRQAAFSLDGRWLAASADQYVGLWDLTSTGPGALTKGGDEVRPTFTNDGKELFASGGEDECSRWRILPGTNAAAPPMLQALAMPAPEKRTSLSIASNLVAITGPRGSGVLDHENLGASAFRWVRTPQGHNKISPDGRWLGVYPRYSPFLYIYRLPGLEPMATLRSQANIGDVAFSTSGNEIAVSTRKGVEFWTTNDWTRGRVLTNFDGILFSPYGSSCWLTTDFRTAGLYNATTLESLLPLPTGTLPLTLTADGRHLAVSVNMRHLQVWDLAAVQNQFRKLGLDWRLDFSIAPERTP
jgi:WD40 repeat protein